MVDWIGFDTYSYSEPGYGHGDFAELLNRHVKSIDNALQRIKRKLDGKLDEPALPIAI